LKTYHNIFQYSRKRIEISQLIENETERKYYVLVKNGITYERDIHLIRYTKNNMIILQEILTEKYGSGQFTQLERGAVKLLY
jgi:hypothetical protein